MSVEYLLVIPVNPEFVPNGNSRKIALQAFKDMLPVAGLVDAVIHEEIRFIDSGENFERVICPVCNIELDQIWWGDAMNAAHNTDFRDLNVRLPCCDSSSTLNDLYYDMPAGFARFLLKAEDPDAGGILTVNQIRDLELILGTRLRQIRAQY